MRWGSLSSSTTPVCLPLLVLSSFPLIPFLLSNLYPLPIALVPSAYPILLHFYLSHFAFPPSVLPALPPAFLLLFTPRFPLLSPLFAPLFSPSNLRLASPCLVLNLLLFLALCSVLLPVVLPSCPLLQHSPPPSSLQGGSILLVCYHNEENLQKGASSCLMNVDHVVANPVALSCLAALTVPPLRPLSVSALPHLHLLPVHLLPSVALHILSFSLHSPSSQHAFVRASTL